MKCSRLNDYGAPKFVVVTKDEIKVRPVKLREEDYAEALWIIDTADGSYYSKGCDWSKMKAPC